MHFLATLACFAAHVIMQISPAEFQNLQMLKGNQDEAGNTWITAQQILDYRGLQKIMKPTATGIKRSAGHRQERIEEISRCISRMENTWIKVHEQEIIDENDTSSKSKKKRRSTISRESRLFMFGDIIYHNELSMDGTPGKSYPIAWQYRESSWMLPFLEGPNRFIGVLLQRTLSYDPYHEQWEKCLAIHFMFYLRINASRQAKPPICIGDLLEEVNLPIDKRNPQRTRDHFEKAMDTLAKDGHLTWDYKGKTKIPAKNWLSTWLQQQIIVDDPPSIKSQYVGIANKAQIVRSQQRIERPRRKRKARRR